MVLVISVAASFIWIKFLMKLETPVKLTGRPGSTVQLFICGLGSVLVALILYELGDRIYFHVAYLSLFTYNVLYVGIIEETAKFIIFFTAASRLNIIKEPKDGLLQAAAVALGFAVLENVVYSSYGLKTLLIRSVLTTTGHMCYAVIWGYAAGLYLFSRRAGRNEYSFTMVAGAVGTSAVLHGLYNYFLNLGLMWVSLAITAAVIGIAACILRYLHGRSPYISASDNQVKDALHSNPGNFQLNKRAGLEAARAGRYAEAGVYLKKASEINRREVSTRVFLVFINLLAGSTDEFGAFRSLERICSNLTAHNLQMLKDRTAQIFARCPEKDKLSGLIDDLIDGVDERAKLKNRRAQFDKAFAAAGSGCPAGGFIISGKDYLPLAYRHPGYYNDPDILS